jgi:hypothetical protein
MKLKSLNEIHNNKLQNVKLKTGKYTGKCITDIPSSYLKYIMENWGGGIYLEAAEFEWNYREYWNVHVEDDYAGSMG